MGVGGQRHTPATLPPGKTRYQLYRRLGGPRAGLDGCGNSRSHRDSIPGPSIQLLYRLSYRGPQYKSYDKTFSRFQKKNNNVKHKHEDGGPQEMTPCSLTFRYQFVI